MISLYRWQPGQRFGTWTELPDLPNDATLIPEGEVWWIDLDDPSEEEEQAIFARFLPVHDLTREDVSRHRRLPDEVPHLPKVEEFPDYLFVIVNPLRPDCPADKPADLGSHCGLVQLSAVLTERLLVTHHQQLLPEVSAVKQFLHRHAGQAGRGPDYVFHLILDQIVDRFAPEIDRIVDRQDEIEESLTAEAGNEVLMELVRMKRRVVSLRKSLILMREVLARLIRGEFDLVDSREIAYYRNVFDHLLRYTELMEGAREMMSDLMQTHLAAVSNRLNTVMKVLAMVSTVILPMSLIASVYGMNFKNLPETEWQYGYPFALALMAAVAALAMYVFWRKRWLS